MNTYFQKKTIEFLKNFYDLTEYKICLYDTLGNELYYFPKKLSSFCDILRKNSSMDEKCKNCEKRAFTICNKTQSKYVYTCHVGLMECVTPVFYNQKILGYIMIGQLRKKGQSFNKIKNLLPKDNLEELKIAYNELKQTSIEKANAAISILDTCTSYEYLKQLVNEKENKIDILIANYINENIANDISTQKLCSVFHLSNNELYSIFKEYFSSTPAVYVKNRRLSYACELLLSSQLKVYTICKKVGFFDYNYFSKVFKKEFGVSPNAYRKKFR